ncbi:uncharacterized protein LOC128723875 [Anopheles nili]|uniref:uncharacterized protein LOC128723875 n=1 Tax=Anopheles nili TaxID=185578 RepID=UPI00237A4D85|nr:uncharacterized protein LOC128723875 [Anopheles nili]
MTFILLLALSCSFFLAFGIKLHYEGFEQTLGQEYYVFDLRVRKYNRTASVINGTIYIIQECGNELVFSLNVYYSRLGNQQFNHLPIHLPTSGLCEFLDNLHKFYPEIVAYFVNAPPAGECPIRFREVHVFDLEYPSQVVPSVLQRKGLWKAVVHGWLNGNEIIQYTTTVKATDD